MRPGLNADGRVRRVEDDAAVVQVPGGGRAGRDAPGSALPGSGMTNDAGTEIDGGEAHSQPHTLLSEGPESKPD